MLFMAFFLVASLDPVALVALVALAALTAFLAIQAPHTLLPLGTRYVRRCVLAPGGGGAHGSGPHRRKLS
jgi:hypothetical protein